MSENKNHIALTREDLIKLLCCVEVCASHIKKCSENSNDSFYETEAKALYDLKKKILSTVKTEL